MIYAFSGFELDMDRFELRHDGEIQHVEPQVFDVLSYLVRNRDRVASKEELLDNVWGDRFVSESALTSRIKAARRALGDNGQRQSTIRTAHGRGYSFIAEVHEVVRSPLGSTGRPPTAGADAPAADDAPAPGDRVAGTGWLVGPPMPIVGRESQLAVLDGLLAQAGAGHGGGVLVAGPAGVGTSSMLVWLSGRAEELHWRVGRGVAAAIEGAWPYAPVLEALADLCRRHPDVPMQLEPDIREEFERAVTGHRGPWSGDESHQRLFVAASEVMRAAAQGPGGVLLVIDDAHEADDASLSLLHYLTRCALGESALVAIGHRSDPCPAKVEELRRSLVARRTAATVDLAPLSHSTIRAVLEGELGGVTDEELEAVWGLSGGLPFQAVEVARRMRATSTQPHSVEGVLVAGVGAPARLLVQRLALIGTTFDLDEVLAVAGISEAETAVRLDECLAARIIEPGGIGYRFRHRLLREALLRELAPHQRRQLHRDIARGLQVIGSSSARIGHHLLEAGERRTAVPYILEAAETQAGLGAYRDALDLLDPIRAHVEGEHEVRLLSLRAELLATLGDRDALGVYGEALAVAGDGQRRLLRAQLARAAVREGDLATAADALEGLQPDGGADDGAILLAQGIYAYVTGDLEAAMAATEHAHRHVIQGRRSWQLLDLVGLQGLIAHTRGEWFELLQEELERADGTTELSVALFDSHLCVAEYLLYGSTPYERVIELTRALRATAERTGALRAAGFAAALIGEASLLAGDLVLAEQELDRAVVLHRNIGATAGEALCLQRLAEVRLATGQRSEANRLLRRALPLARWSLIANHLVQRIYGTMIRAADDPTMARALVDQAEAIIGNDDFCFFCGIMWTLPAAIACADADDLPAAEAYLSSSEEHAQFWEGTSWQAAISEARAHLLLAQGRHDEAFERLTQAAQVFSATGQPLDAERCRTTGRTRSGQQAPPAPLDAETAGPRPAATTVDG